MLGDGLTVSNRVWFYESLYRDALKKFRAVANKEVLGDVISLETFTHAELVRRLVAHRTSVLESVQI